MDRRGTRPVRCRLGLLPLMAALASGCETGDPFAPEALAAAEAVVSHPAPYPVFGQIERIEPGIDRLIPIDAKLELLAEGFDWSEGPVWVDDGDYLLFSDIPPNLIYRWSAADGVALFLHPSGYDGRRTDIPQPGSNGLALDIDGGLLLAEHGNRRIAKLPILAAPREPKTTLADRYDGRRLNSPNDLVVAANGDVYFTDPPYGLTGQSADPDKELAYQGIYLVRRGANAVELLAKQSRPNGIGLSPDGGTLYVSNSDAAAPYIYAYAIRDDGTLGNRSVLFDARTVSAPDRRGAPDGMAVDEAGNLWATGPGGVLVIDPQGRHLGTILTGEATANCTFGEGGRSLFITADSKLARLRLE